MIKILLILAAISGIILMMFRWLRPIGIILFLIAMVLLTITQKRKTDKNTILWLICAVMIVMISIIAIVSSDSGSTSSSYSSSSNSSDTRTCSYCDRSFNLSDNRDDFWSIKRTNMCENCYRNYKSLEQFIGQ